jgi:hypothetical protein
MHGSMNVKFLSVLPIICGLTVVPTQPLVRWVQRLKGLWCVGTLPLGPTQPVSIWYQC